MEELIKKIQDQMKVIAKDRDKLRDVVEEAETLLGDLDEAYECLECAVEAMSRMV